MPFSLESVGPQKCCIFCERVKREAYFSSCVMTTSWKFDCALLVSIMFLSASARDSLLAASRFVVGSSNARIPHLRQKVSARASRMMRQARTCKMVSLRSDSASKSLVGRRELHWLRRCNAGEGVINGKYSTLSM